MRAKRESARRVLALLREEYGTHAAETELHATDSLIATIISQHTASRNSRAAHERLKSRYPTWQDVANADVSELAETIRPAGLAGIKAARIHAALASLQERYGTADLAMLRGMELRDARDILTALPGVGMKTASCVLLFACDLPALAVDTHVHRLARRLGWIAGRTSAEAAHEELEAIVPPEDVYDMHVNLISHGRAVCHAREPRCQMCVLQRLCPTYMGRAA